VLGALLGTAAGRLLVVMTGRPDGWLPTGRLHEVFDLAPLTDEQADALIGALNPGMTADQRAAVAARCDGVPFYIEQVVNGRSEIGVPEALYEPLFARLRASPKVVPVVEAAAILGRQIDRHLLCSVVDVGDDEVDDVIHELEDALVLEPLPAGNWRFRHELLREIAAELAPPSVRRGLHAKVAAVLIGAGEPDWRLVAAHYEHAARFDNAASAYQRASSDARQRGALAEARTCLTLALTQLNQATRSTDRDRCETALRLERGFVSFAAEGYQSRQAAADFERCLQLGETNLRNDELFATLTAVGNYYLIRADLRRATKVLEVLHAGLEGRQWFRPAIEILAGAAAWLRGDFDAADNHLQVATADVAAADKHKVDADGLLVSDSSATARLYLALVGLVRGATRAPMASWPLPHAWPTGSDSHGPRTRTPTRAPWPPGCASRPANSIVPRSSPRTQSIMPNGTASTCGHWWARPGRRPSMAWPHSTAST
jgi:tetratricopeptide (TPR) repeat protein